ncbi:MAG: hypothetical protein IPN59_12670 [Holophaga sp.]|nr:hypothetical protein [Holophaga sp.]
MYNNLYYPNSLNYAHGLTITLPARSAGAFSADMALDGRGSLSGLVLDSVTSQPLEGIHLVIRGLNYPDRQTNAWCNVCTDATGAYKFDGIDRASSKSRP